MSLRIGGWATLSLSSHNILVEINTLGITVAILEVTSAQSLCFSQPFCKLGICFLVCTSLPLKWSL